MAEQLRYTTMTTINTLKGYIEETLPGCASLEEAAQKVTNLLFEQFEESILVIRFFATIPFRMLPALLQIEVRNLVNTEGIPELLREETPVLTLLGAHGGEEIENRKQTFGLPLVSSAYITAIPMIAELLKKLGFTLHNSDIETHSLNFLSGVFYVPDAQHAVNTQGQKILSQIDRIAVYTPEILPEIQTIFGIGGAYISGPFIALILCSREVIEKKIAAQFMPVANYIKTATTKLVLNNRIFAQQ